jgi:hypothetical protein
VPLGEDELEAGRRRPAYRTAIWLYRAALAVLLLLFVLLYSDLVRDVPPVAWIGIAGATVLATVLVEWVGARTLEVDGSFWRLQKVVLKEVFGLGPR